MRARSGISSSRALRIGLLGLLLVCTALSGVWLAGRALDARADAHSFVPLGPEFQVNTYTTSDQKNPAVAIGPTGSFVVVWQSTGQDGGQEGVFGQRYSSGGAPAGPEFRLNSLTSISHLRPAVAAQPTGGFVVVWQSPAVQGSDDAIFAQRYDSAGAPLGDNFVALTGTLVLVSGPRLAALASGGFVITWQAPTSTGGDSILARRFSSAGQPLSGTFQVDSHTGSTNVSPSLSSNDAGDFVISWEIQPGPLDPGGIFAQRYSSSGSPAGSEFSVWGVGTLALHSPSVALDRRGGFVVVWSAASNDGTGTAGIFGRRFSSGGAALDTEAFTINSLTLVEAHSPNVAMDRDGDFKVSWGGYYMDYPNDNTFARRFQSSGAPLGSDFRLNALTSVSTLRSAISSAPNGDFVVVWQTAGSDGDGDGIYAKRYGRDLDDDGVADALDPDDDADTVPDEADCRPFDPGVSQLPSEVPPTSLHLTQVGTPQNAATVVSWAPAQPGGTAPVTYLLYKGVPSDLPKLVTDSGPGGPALPDSCLRWVGVSQTATGPFVRENPAPGSFFWFLVRAQNTCGKGSAGQASSVPRSQLSNGSCSTCTHSKCTVDGNMSPLSRTCDPCVNLVCGADPSCCSQRWDAHCVAQVATVCHSLACGDGQATCSHGLCAEGAHLAPGCDAGECVASVCAVEPSCCSAFWDARCTARVDEVCAPSTCY